MLKNYPINNATGVSDNIKQKFKLGLDRYYLK